MISRKIIIFLRGGPAVGKSSVAEELSKKLPYSAKIEQDILRYMVTGGLVASKKGLHPSAAPDEYTRQCHLGDKNSLALAKNFAESGFLPIIAGFNGGESAETFYLLKHPDKVRWYPDKEFLMQELPGFIFFQVVLDTSPLILSERLKARGFEENTIRFILNQRELFLNAVSQTHVDILIDTSQRDPTWVAEKVINELNLAKYF